MTKSSQSKNSDNGKWYENQALVLTLIGVAGTIVAALISISPQIAAGFQKLEPTLTPLPATATTFIETTSSPTPTEMIISPTESLSPTPTETASPSPTPTPVSPPISCLDRWQVISSNLDLIETSAAGNCEAASVPGLGIAASREGISFGVNNFRERGTFGITTPLPVDATITLSVNLTVLTQGEFWIALSNTPTPESNMFILGFQPNTGELRTYSDQTSAFSEKYKYSDLTSNTNFTSGPPFVYNITLETSGNRVSQQIHFTDLPSHVVNLPNYLFIGFDKTSTLGSMTLQVEISELTVDIE